MKYLPFLMLLIGYFSSQSQTLTQQANEPKIGDFSRQVLLDTSAFINGMPLNQSGQNQNWDFSGLKTASDPDSTKYLDPSAVPGATIAPGTTVVQDNSGVFLYLKSVASPAAQTELLGLTMGAQLVVSFTNPAIAAKYPITYNSTSSDNCAGSLISGTMNLNCNGRLTYTADGTGTLTLADGFVYNNVLRLKSILSFTASQFGFPAGNVRQTQYDFYYSTEKFPVFSVQYMSFSFLGSSDATAFASGNQNFFTSVVENKLQESVSVYPSPASGFLTVNLSDNTIKLQSTEISDLSGRKLITHQPESASVTGVDVSGLSAGIYLVRISDGTHTITRKWVKD